jgi:hypothetical protein
MIACLLAFARGARAWEPEGADVNARMAELTRAWKGLDPDAQTKDKVKRRKQAGAPSWINKTDFRAKAADGRELAYGVGLVEGVKNKALALTAAEDRAKVALLHGAHSGRIHSESVDWYLDKDGVTYALTLDLDSMGTGAVEKPSQSKTVAQTEGAILTCLAGQPTACYLAWASAPSNTMGKPMLVFQNPADEAHPALPTKVYVRRKPLPAAKGKPFQIWTFPEKPGQRGLYAAVLEADGKGGAKRLAPILWWGLSKGQELDALGGAKVAAALKSLGLE